MVRATMLWKVYDHLETLRVYKIYIRIISTVTNLQQPLRGPLLGILRILLLRVKVGYS
jgi:hypothetical protein